MRIKRQLILLLSLSIIGATHLSGQDLISDFSKVYKKYMERSSFVVTIQTYQYNTPKSTGKEIGMCTIIKDQDLIVSEIEERVTIKRGNEILYIDKEKRQMYYQLLVNAEIAMSLVQYNQLLQQINKTNDPKLEILNGKKIYSFGMSEGDIRKMEVVLGPNDQLEKIVYQYNYDNTIKEEENIYKIEVNYIEKAVGLTNLSQYNFQNYFKKENNKLIPVGKYQGYKVLTQ